MSSPGRSQELDATSPDEDRRGLDSLLDERLAMLETSGEEALVRRDRLVEVGHRDADVMDALHGAMLSAPVSPASEVLVPFRSSPTSGTRERRPRAAPASSDAIERLLLEQRLGDTVECGAVLLQEPLRLTRTRDP